jgi:hypothetical protein
MEKFVIAELKVSIDSDNNKIVEHMEGYREDFTGSADLKLEIVNVDNINHPVQESLNAEGVTWHIDENGSINAYLWQMDKHKLVATFVTDANWNQVSIEYIGSFELVQYDIDRLMGIFMLFSAVRHKALTIHASVVECYGKGLIFTAPSGTGKSTQANLWVTHKGAKVINGDRALIKIDKGSPYVFGIPWSGSQRIYLNQKVPLCAIIIIEQAKENKIRQISSSDALVRILPRCFLPYVDKVLLEEALGNLERIIGCIPIYLFGCKPDEAAVELVYQTVMKE